MGGGRITWDHYFMQMAEVVKLRSPDPRRKVGSVLVNKIDNHLISTGYNGLVSGSNDKIDWNNRELVYSLILHAEVNCILHARNLSKNETLKMYITTSPCKECIKILASMNIKEIYYKDEYRDIQLVEEICNFYNINLVKL
jgi:dCMP deaminase